MFAFRINLKTALMAIILATPALADPVKDEAFRVPVSLTATPAQVGAPTIATPDTPLSAIRIVTTSIASAAKLVADKHGLSVQVSDAVQGNLSNLILTGDADQMMALIGSEADIIWFTYGGTLQVSAKSENVTRFIPTGDLSRDIIDQSLAASEIDASQLDLLHMPDSSAVRVSGPPKAIEIVEAVLLLAEEEAPVVVSDAIVVRRGIAKSLEIYGQAAAPELANAPAPEPVPEQEPDQEEAADPETEQSADES